MLIMAEGRLPEAAGRDQDRATAAWLGPMMDSGFLHAGWIRGGRGTMLLLISAPDLGSALGRLADLPLVRDLGLVFDLQPVTALRFR